MKVFVSWSGSLSQGVATILHKYLDCIIQNLEVFVSKHDIESGARWASRLAEELEDTDFGILCLSPESLHEDWLLFEAGALTKKMEGRACGLLIDGLSATDVSGPLAQFQHRVFERDGFRALLVDINAALKAPLKPKQLDMLFEKFWPDINTEYESVVNSSRSDTSPQPERTERDLIEEVLAIVRGIPGQITLRAITRHRDVLAATKHMESVNNLSGHDRTVLNAIGIHQHQGQLDYAKQIAESNPDTCERLIEAGLVQRDVAGQITVVNLDSV